MHLELVVGQCLKSKYTNDSIYIFPQQHSFGGFFLRASYRFHFLLSPKTYDKAASSNFLIPTKKRFVKPNFNRSQRRLASSGIASGIPPVDTLKAIRKPISPPFDTASNHCFRGLLRSKSVLNRQVSPCQLASLASMP